jgi:sec-independent protein translocase protein TatB
MFDIGFSELLIVGVLGLIILGPERLPKAARTVGLLIGRVRQTMGGIQQQIEQEVRNQEIREKLEDPLRTFLSDEEVQQRQETEDSNRLANGDQGVYSVDDHQALADAHAHHEQEQEQEQEQPDASTENELSTEQAAAQPNQEPK